MKIKLFNKGFNSFNRLISKNFVKNNFEIKNNNAIISFTFDDFPESTTRIGLELLEKHGAKATYYISFGLVNKITATGRIASIEDIKRIVENGNDLGCHTFNHLGAYEQNSVSFEDSLIENNKFLLDNFPGKNFSVFSYPKGQVNLRAKKIVQKYFYCSRGIVPGINSGIIDLNLLKGTRLYGDEFNFDWNKQFIDQNRKIKGWLIFYTHDISPDPTPYGCTPELFEKVIKYSKGSGATILSIEEVCNTFLIPRITSKLNTP
jgi:peptidoglycan/xylan/chitin deacetylase (PgdA/CDA1 family)